MLAHIHVENSFCPTIKHFDQPVIEFEHSSLCMSAAYLKNANDGSQLYTDAVALLFTFKRPNSALQIL